MKIVVDTNIIFSATLPKAEKFRDLLSDKKNTFYSCNFAILEIFKYKEKLIKASKTDSEIILTNVFKVLNCIHFINENLISAKNLEKAEVYCSGIDAKDTPFIALALELDAHLWTGDKDLIEKLPGKGFTKIAMTADLM